MAVAVMPVVTAAAVMAVDTRLATREAVMAVDTGLATIADVILQAATMLTSVKLTPLGASGLRAGTSLIVEAASTTMRSATGMNGIASPTTAGPAGGAGGGAGAGWGGGGGPGSWPFSFGTVFSVA